MTNTTVSGNTAVSQPHHVILLIWGLIGVVVWFGGKSLPLTLLSVSVSSLSLSLSLSLSISLFAHFCGQQQNVSKPTGGGNPSPEQLIWGLIGVVVWFGGKSLPLTLLSVSVSSLPHISLFLYFRVVEFLFQKLLLCYYIFPFVFQ